MPEPKADDFTRIYEGFDAPISALDCGKKCAPYNEYGVPFCCDTAHAIPTAYAMEWEYLKSNTNLWHPWESDDLVESVALRAETPEGQILIACLGHRQCQRGFRSVTCRAFPFFPYITLENEFIGLSYYWQYEDRCWVISHLDTVTLAYQQGFIATYDWLLKNFSGELENFRYHSIMMRRIFGRQKRSIPLMHRDGGAFHVLPKDGSLKSVKMSDLPKYGPYQIAALMPFPDER